MDNIHSFTVPNYTDIPDNYFLQTKKMSIELGIILSDDDIKRRSGYIRDMYECHGRCNICQGYETCTNDNKGYVLTYSKDTDTFSIGECDKKRQYDIKKCNDRLFASCHMPADVHHDKTLSYS